MKRDLAETWRTTRTGLLLALALLATSRHAFGQAGLMTVADKEPDRAYFVDAATLTVVGEAPTGGHPDKLAVTSDGRTAFVAHYSIATIACTSAGEVAVFGMCRRGSEDTAFPTFP